MQTGDSDSDNDGDDEKDDSDLDDEHVGDNDYDSDKNLEEQSVSLDESEKESCSENVPPQKSSKKCFRKKRTGKRWFKYFHFLSIYVAHTETYLNTMQ